ncbi:PI-PLC X domain-containing protein 1 isoform X1 [Antennarius striatus]|uniref:PI-PLC X domain-containing protein 1 isoform X1 n=1 Tax=Antennarius striatus TaxID=241820 RepID=UPI0035AEEA63
MMTGGDRLLLPANMEPSAQDWMSALPEELWDVPLSSLALPGSHDAMSYCLDINSPLVPSEPDTFRLLDGLLSCLTRPLIFKWTTTQDKSIEEQLSMGIRYFDLRIAHKPNDSSSDLYFTHIIYTHLTALDALLSVASWLHSHPKEIVILACSHFEGINDQLHQAFIFTLKKLFGSKLCPRTESDLTLRSLWSSGYQVILSYDSETALSHQELWPAIPYWWANQRTAKGVISYLEFEKDLGRPGEFHSHFGSSFLLFGCVFKKLFCLFAFFLPKDGFFVSGLNLTADRSYIIKNPKQSLRTLTFSNWESLRKWLEDQHPGSSPRSLNIIAGDFLGPLPLCSLVIALNQKLLKKNSIK